MSPRVTVDDVRAIYDTDVSDSGVQFWIDVAHDHLADTVEAADPSVTEERLTKLERVLAAHFLAGSDPTEESVAAGDFRATYESSVGEGINETRFGRRAAQLDPTQALIGETKPTAIFETFGHDSEDWS